ncbi:glycoside hydrolase family 18 protein [Bacillus sp. ISL-51]|uniref:glycosyl hydrolase family 18 protein n=1 Tax=Bacteria TaxID=2 RepID=UPI001BE9F726|nr:MULTISPECIES: glycosyl hydrolase family 18 protein [Bacteria]MBT2573642.1 glycoside hydrolase family 18 protein [Bacillus sp. ISL-51]MBT2712505.1 glycoside hydrolase family 18 protein [Pseudomonas sp. ISL-88]
MFVHTVQSGDTLFSISRRYGFPVDRIRSVNGLEETNIVPGQALLIPLYEYTVQPNDTYAVIASKSYVLQMQLMQANPAILPNRLQAGMKVRIPDISNYLAGTLQFYVIRTPEADRALINDYAPYSSAISLFEYHFGPNGDLLNDLNDKTAIETTWKNRVRPHAVITNLTGGGFSSDLAHQVLQNPSARTNLVNNIVSLTTRKGYGGVNIDFERISEADRDLFTGFLRELKNRLSQHQLALTISVPAKTSEGVPWLRGYDYGGIGAVVDYMFIMAYDWHHAGSEPGAVAPLTEVRETINFAISRVPRRKVILGVPLYGYDWLIPYKPGTIGTAISNQRAIETAMKHQSAIHYSEQDRSPYFRYTDEQGRAHEVWFEDVRSMSEKMVLVREFGLQAIGAWQLTLGFNPGPWLLRKFFTIRKI